MKLRRQRLLLRQSVAGNRARGRHADGADDVSAARRANRHGPAGKIDREVLFGRDIGGGLAIFEGPLRLGHLERVKVGDTGVAGGIGRGRLVFRLQLLQVLLLQLDRGTSGAELLAQLLAFCLEPTDIILQLRIFLQQGLVVGTQLDGGGIGRGLGLVEFRLGHLRLLDGLAGLGLGFAFLLVGGKEKQFAGDERYDEDPQENVLQLHVIPFSRFRRSPSTAND